MAPQPTERTLGRLLIERGYATEEQIAHCVDLQKRRSSQGDFVRIGQIVVEQGIASTSQIDEVLEKEQRISILLCSLCSAQYNIHNYSKNTVYKCPQCRGKLRRPRSLESLTIRDTMKGRGRPRREAGPMDTVKAAPKKRNLPPLPEATQRPPSDSYQAERPLDESRRFGDFEILGEIARGGMGIIYKARQITLNRLVALKTLRAEEAERGDAVERFTREAQAVASLQHPNLVAVHSVQRIGDIHFFTMEYVEGLPLDSLLKQNGALDPDQAVEVLLPILEALAYAHSQGVVHRDLKPANIIIDTHGTPFLVDFGIAKRKGDQQLTETGEILGSVPYMAPEYIMGDPFSEACDVYSFGVVFYEALAGYENLPFGGESDDEETIRLLKRIAYEQPAPIKQFRPDCDPDLQRIVMKAITRDLKLRYTKASDLVADFKAWQKQRQRQPVGSVEPQVIVKKAKASPLSWVLAAIFLLAGVWLGVLLLAERKQKLQSERQIYLDLLEQAEDLAKRQPETAETMKAFVLRRCVDRQEMADIAEKAK